MLSLIGSGGVNYPLVIKTRTFHSESCEWKSPVRLQRFRKNMAHFFRSEDGPTSVEYAVILALIIAIAIVAVRALGDNQTGMWGGTLNKLDAAGFTSN